MLLYELTGTEPDLVPILRGRAGAWLEDEGFVEGAIRQATAAEDYERVGLLITRHWRWYVFSGQAATVQRWLGSLPEGMIARDAALALVKAWICALGGRREECERFLRLAEGIPHEGLPDGTASVESGVTILRAIFGFDGIQSKAEAARRATELERGATSPWAAMVRFAMGTSLYLIGETSQARMARGGYCPGGWRRALGARDGPIVPVFRCCGRRARGRSRITRVRPKGWWRGYVRMGYPRPDPRPAWRRSRLAVRLQNSGGWRKLRKS